MRPEIVGRAALSARVVGRAPAGWWAHAGTDLVLLDPALVAVATVPIGTAWSAVQAVRPDLSAVAVSDEESVRVIARDGTERWRFAHTPWGTGYSLRGSCAFTADGGAVFATMPETEALCDQYADAGPDEDEESDSEFWGDQWCVFDAETGAVRRWWWLDAEATGSSAHPHPSGTVLLDLGEGQDGSRIYLGDPATALVALPGVDRALAGLHPSGDRFLSVPRDGSGLVVHAFPGGARVGTEPGSPAPAAGEWYGGCAGYLGADRILSGTVSRDWNWAHDLVFDATDLTLLGEVEYREESGGALAVGTDGTWITSTGTQLIAWRLAP
jgi:hypothetical protein